MRNKFDISKHSFMPYIKNSPIAPQKLDNKDTNGLMIIDTCEIIDIISIGNINKTLYFVQ